MPIEDAKNPLSLKGRVALVTGASRGIGRATAEILAAHGSDLFLTAREDAPLQAAAQDIAGTYSVACHAVAADIADADATAALYQQLFKTFKRLDILVNNAGILDDALLGMLSIEKIAHSLNVNVAGALYHTQAAARLMRRGKTGSIVTISSIIATHGNAGQSLYGATKAALIGMTLSAAKELAPDNIRVNAVAPGYIETAMTAKLDPAIQETRRKSILIGRTGTPEDVARTVLFLASDLSAYVTGQVVGVDGGMVI